LITIECATYSSNSPTIKVFDFSNSKFSNLWLV
jgi:hypothetical protein